MDRLREYPLVTAEARTRDVLRIWDRDGRVAAGCRQEKRVSRGLIIRSFDRHDGITADSPREEKDSYPKPSNPPHGESLRRAAVWINTFFSESRRSMMPFGSVETA